MPQCLYLNQIPIPVANTAKYLGLYLHRRLTWNSHTRLKRLDVNRRYKLILIDNRSSLSLDNTVLLYNTIFKPIWTYRLELWSSAKPSNISRIQTLQSKILRKICNAPFFVSNLTLHKDLKVPFVKDMAVKSFTHPNPLVQRLSSRTHPDDSFRRFRRQ
jgi:hypothetical protein